MSPQTVQTIAAWCGAQLLQGSAEAMVTHVSTDTRSIRPGALFVALAGEKFDAHDFAAQAAAAGATALLVSRPVEVPAGTAVLLAEDSLAALQRLAAAWRKVWGGTVIGLTGSNGKTSTKDLVNSVLSQRAPVSATRGNLNNHIGLPLTVLEASPEHRYGVFEMGMNHFGEIAPLAAISAPDIAVITNIGTAHIEFMGSREGIAQEKGVLAEAVHKDGCVVLNANDDMTPGIAARCVASILTAGIEAGDVQVSEPEISPDGCRFDLRLPDGSVSAVLLKVPGRHMAANAALAAAAGWHLGLRAEEIVRGLDAAVLNKGRLQFREAAGLRFLDDSYNANPESMQAALDTLRSIPVKRHRIAVLGRMGERGESADAEHRALGAAVHAAGIYALHVVGGAEAQLIGDGYVAAGGQNLSRAETHAACAATLRAAASQDDLILVKGSRSAAMERVIDLIQA